MIGEPFLAQKIVRSVNPAAKNREAFACLPYHLHFRLERLGNQIARYELSVHDSRTPNVFPSYDINLSTHVRI